MWNFYKNIYSEEHLQTAVSVTKKKKKRKRELWKLNNIFQKFGSQKLEALKDNLLGLNPEKTSKIFYSWLHKKCTKCYES